MINHGSVATRIRLYKKEHYTSPKFLVINQDQYYTIGEHKEFVPSYEQRDPKTGDTYMGLVVTVTFDMRDEKWRVE